MTLRGSSAAQAFAVSIGFVYFVIGVLGVFVANDFLGGQADDELVVFRVNHLHNLIHIGLGAIWVSSAQSFGLAKNVNRLLGSALLVLALVGFTGIELVHTLLNITSSMDPDNFLHLGTGLLALYFGIAATGHGPTSTTT